MREDPQKRARQTIRRLEGAGRLRALAAAAPPVPAGQGEIQRLKAYLIDWVKWQQEYRPHLGMPGSSSFAPDMTAAQTATEYAERSDRWAMEVIQQAVEEDLLERLEGSAMRAALRVRLLNEAVGARVFRHGRLAPLYPHEVDALADRAERELVVIVKRRGLPLV